MNGQRDSMDFFTGNPRIAGLGRAFLFRNYRPGLGKWQTIDPLGYPDGCNNLAYVNNKVTRCFDWQGTVIGDGIWEWEFQSMTDSRDNNSYYSQTVYSTHTPSGYTGTYTITSYQYYYSGTTHIDEVLFYSRTVRDVFYSIKSVVTVTEYYDRYGVIYKTDFSAPVESDGPIGILTRNYLYLE